METITHPCQEMALAMALQEHLGDLKGKKFLLTWADQPGRGPRQTGKCLRE